MNFTDLVLHIDYPDCNWYWENDDNSNYDNLVWLESNPIPKPPRDEVEKKALEMEHEHKSTEYQRLRAVEYPSITELADALYWNSKGVSSHLESYYAACEEVKNKYPKPQ